MELLLFKIEGVLIILLWLKIFFDAFIFSFGIEKKWKPKYYIIDWIRKL